MLNERGLSILTALDHVAAERGVGLATVSLAWLMHRPSITAPIASATNLEQLRELMLATELALDQSEIDILDNASAY
jgi:aryl-alcohol dehydrogenase-like predicted oxidoreductase